jgi:hypothetical protein
MLYGFRCAAQGGINREMRIPKSYCKPLETAHRVYIFEPAKQARIHGSMPTLARSGVASTASRRPSAAARLSFLDRRNGFTTSLAFGFIRGRHTEFRPHGHQPIQTCPQRLGDDLLGVMVGVLLVQVQGAWHVEDPRIGRDELDLRSVRFKPHKVTNSRVFTTNFLYV